MKWKRVIASLQSSQYQFPSRSVFMSDVSRVEDSEPPKAFMVTVRVTNPAMNAITLVKFSAPRIFLPLTEIYEICEYRNSLEYLPSLIYHLRLWNSVLYSLSLFISST